VGPVGALLFRQAHQGGPGVVIGARAAQRLQDGRERVLERAAGPPGLVNVVRAPQGGVVFGPASQPPALPAGDPPPSPPAGGAPAPPGPARPAGPAGRTGRSSPRAARRGRPRRGGGAPPPR